MYIRKKLFMHTPTQTTANVACCATGSPKRLPASAEKMELILSGKPSNGRDTTKMPLFL